MYRFHRNIAAVLLVLVALPLIVAACGASSNSDSGSSGGTTVNVTLDEFKFSSSVTTFTKGTTYHFVMKNNGKVPHELLILPNGSTDSSKALLTVGADKFPAGGSTTVDYTFNETGTFQFGCLLPGHYEQGMHLPITVK